MTTPPILTDRKALTRNRKRALRKKVLFLHETAADDVKDRLAMVNKSFKAPALVTGHPEFWQSQFPQFAVVEDHDVLDLAPGSFDLVIHAMSLHWSNDTVGQLIQCRRALKPDGMFLAVLFGGQTLNELRSSLAQAESELTGGLSPRIAPMAEIRDLGGLLQRAGFALPVADGLTLKARYSEVGDLMRDLRGMGENNALHARLRRPASRRLLARANDIYLENFADADGRIPATFELIFLIGWAPDPSQPKPLRPGSASARLADVLGTDETTLKD